MTDSAPILKTHPEYRHGQLVDYGNPEALRWIRGDDLRNHRQAQH